MSQVEFEEQGNEYQRSRSFVAQELSGIAKFIIKLGIAKNEAQAKVVMIIITLLCFAITFFVIFSGGAGRDTSFEKKYPPGSPAVQP